MQSPDPKEHILSVAERLFATQGFAGTSLRSVTREAGVNLAAVHYYFGSKEELFSSVVRRFAKPIVQSQLDQLEEEEYEAQEKPLPIENILNAFFAPPLRIIRSLGEQGEIVAEFMGRCQTEPDPVQRLAQEEFAESRKRFLKALQRTFPQKSPLELEWKFELIIAALIHTLIRLKRVGVMLEGESNRDVELTIQSLVNFMAAGMGT